MSHQINATENRPLVAGLDIAESVADEAAQWLTLIMSDEVTDADQAALLQWRSAHPEHERAWVHLETVLGRINGLDSAVAYKTLASISEQDAAEFSGRRKAMHTLLWLGVTGVSVLAASRTTLIKQQFADYHTATGELRHIQLDDGTRVTLNTATAINIQFDTHRRVIKLIAGEIMIITGHKPNDTRPLVVETREGTVRALGTQFSVYQQERITRVAVLESAVEVSLPNSASYQRIHTGEQVSFTRTAIAQPTAVVEQSPAWLKGQIIADEMRLDDFLTELSRYRPGVIRCDPAVAELRFSGVFPLADTDQILLALPNALPVAVNSRTRYWVTVTTAANN